VLQIIALMMEAARTSETSIDIQLRTRQHIPEDSELHIRRRENLKSHFYTAFNKEIFLNIVLIYQTMKPYNTERK
jgi:hypothetical protein